MFDGLRDVGLERHFCPFESSHWTEMMPQKGVPRMRQSWKVESLQTMDKAARGECWSSEVYIFATTIKSLPSLSM